MNDASPLERVVPADGGGSSCLPGVAQRAVPDESCDLRGRWIEAEKDFSRACEALKLARQQVRETAQRRVDYWRDYCNHKDAQRRERKAQGSAPRTTRINDQHQPERTK